jgi:hypothetical protein
MGIEELGHKVLRRHEAAIIILDAGILQKGVAKRKACRVSKQRVHNNKKSWKISNTK